MKIYVGNLSPDITKAQLEKAFAIYGPVTQVDIIIDKNTGMPQGYAFIEMTNEDDGNKAITNLHQQEFNGTIITVTEAGKQNKVAAR